MRKLCLVSSFVAVGACGKQVDDVFQQPTTTLTTSAGVDSSTGDDTLGAESSTGEPGTTTDVSTTLSTTAPADTSGDSSSGGGDAVCGDGVRSGSETCDGEDFGDASCASQGFQTGTLVCNATCQGFDTSGCYICGNGALEPAEDCDGVVGPNVDCVDAGFTAGTVTCDPVTCLYNTSECSLCGDGVQSGPEACDGDDLGGATCQSVGFDAGEIACADTCGFDFSGCSGGQYLQDFESGLLAPEFALSGDANWSVTGTMPINGSFSAMSGDISDGGETSMQLSVNYAIAGTVAFAHRESSESNYDYLEFWIDNVMQDEWSGANATANELYNVAAGVHTLRWSYTKDGSLSSNSDAVWVDDIVLVGGVPQ
ncbi:MAG: hypothetical protein IPH07_14395 [Deltaproteobacteria bacterium]|nr:hypothetical protein [Deltaproteobacteria bacterium]MBK8717480.1 hypothetical protein [Deltaproteobacteria bacterium]MBP7289602.1 hypothetical protein [Nannocystaceae bacterium]